MMLTMVAILGKTKLFTNLPIAWINLENAISYNMPGAAAHDFNTSGGSSSFVCKDPTCLICNVAYVSLYLNGGGHNVSRIRRFAIGMFTEETKWQAVRV